MAEEVRMWEVGDGELKAIERSKLDAEKRIEEWIKSDICVLDPALLVIGQQVETDCGKFIDLLCMDVKANLVIVELKRDKAPRDVTAQALEYASWVEDLDAEQIAAIAAKYFKTAGSSLESAFEAKFGAGLPDPMNESHAIRIVASEFEDSTERVIRYLSETYGVDINAARFQFFSMDGRQLLVRTFTVAEDVAQSNTSKQPKRRRPAPTPKEMEQAAIEAGVGDLYRKFEQALGGKLKARTYSAGLSFDAELAEGIRVVFNLVPGESSADKGLRFRVYLDRLREFVHVDEAVIADHFPLDAEPWQPWPGLKGLAGYIRSEDDVRKVASLITDKGPAA